MTWTARRRDRYRLAVNAVTGIATIGALSSTGWMAGATATDYEQEQQARQIDAKREAARYERLRARYDARLARHHAAVAAQRTELRQRPAKVRVTTRYVTSAGNPVGGGGTVTAPAPPAGTTPAPASASPAGPAPTAQPAPAPPPPPPPPPPPAPTSGSGG